MKFKIDTAKMSYLLSKVAYGVGKKYTHPITECLRLFLDNGCLVLESTNGVNFVSIQESGIEGESGECIVKADTLIKLVEKTTKSELSFSLKETYLEVKGNGTYKVQTVIEEFPKYEFDASTPQIEVSTDVLKRVFKVNDAAIATELIMPCLTGYNVGDNVITTDGIKMCINATKIVDERVLITQALADLISKTITADKVTIQKEDNKLLISSDNITIFGTELDGLAEYPDITGILQYDYSRKAVVSKQELLSVLDRLSLFVDQFDNNGVRISFQAEQIDLTDLKQNSQEALEYVDKIFEEQMDVLLNIGFLKDILSVISGDNVTIQYDPQLPLKIEDGQVTFFLGTMNAV